MKKLIVLNLVLLVIFGTRLFGKDANDANSQTATGENAQQKSEQAKAAEKYTKYETAGMSFEYPADWKSFPRDVVAGMKSSMASELSKYNRTLRVLEMYTSPNEEVAFFFSSTNPEPSITAQSVVAERKKVHEDAMKAGDVTKVNALSEVKVNKWSAVREDVEQSNGERLHRQSPCSRQAVGVFFYRQQQGEFRQVQGKSLTISCLRCLHPGNPRQLLESVARWEHYSSSCQQHGRLFPQPICRLRPSTKD